MNKNQLKLMHYGTMINDVITKTESTQEGLNPEFEALRNAIDSDKLADFDKDAYVKTQADFKAGTATYQDLLKQLETAAVPARLIGNHKLLAGSYARFVDACVAMTNSLGDDVTIDTAAFDAAEKIQDEETDKITKYLQKISVLV